MGTIDGVTENLERTMSGLKDGVANATAGLEQAQSSLRDGMATSVKTAEAVISFGQGNVEAMTQSGQIFAAGLQTIGQTMAETAQASFNDLVSTFRAMAGVKSVREALELQSTMLRSTMERAVSQSSSIAEESMKLSAKSFAPIGARLSVAAGQFGQAGR